MEGGGIPMFDGKGYEIWSKKMKTLFVSQELWDLVRQGYQEVGGLRENRKKDCKALYMIQQGVSDSIFPVIMKANTSKEAWKAIRDQFHDDPVKMQIEELQEIWVDIQRRLSKLIKNPIYQDRCIFRVPDALRLGNEEFYDPKMLSIGPYHRGKPRLASMEEHKFCYLQDLLQRMGEQSVECFVRAIKPYEERVRKCYAESIDYVSSDDLIQMLVLDGCFIIELFCRMRERRDQHYRSFRDRQSDEDDPEADVISSNFKLMEYDNDPVINFVGLLNRLQTDIFLLENQIPFFIIQILNDLISHTPTGDSPIENINNLILPFLCRKYGIYELFGQRINFRPNLGDKRHLLDIAHKTICPRPPIKEKELVRNSEDFTFRLLNDVTFRFVDSATNLEEANVTLKAGNKLFGSNILDITFSNGKLMIPSFNINYQFEDYIRNFIALELCQKDRKNRYFCDYVVFMDHLIATHDDFKLLIRRGIITNQIIDANLVDNMFKRLAPNILISDPYTYYQVYTDLNKYRDQDKIKYCVVPMNKWWASFLQTYFKTPWTFISFLAASMLLALTFTQTMYSIISYYK